MLGDAAKKPKRRTETNFANESYELKRPADFPHRALSASKFF
jgi:hypothetical protein